MIGSKEVLLIILAPGLLILSFIVISMIKDWKWQRYKRSKKCNEEISKAVVIEKTLLDDLYHENEVK